MAAANDALVVVAAMNDSKDNDTGHTPTWPCNFTHPNLLCVAALDSDGDLSDFSNYGAASVDVGAPGRSILSLSPQWARLTPPGLDSFESDIVGRWYGNGSWARTSAFAASLAFSLTDSPAGHYANDTTPWIAMTNGVDLTGRQGCRMNYAVRGRVLDGDMFVTGVLDQWGTGHVATADSVDTHGAFETWSDPISVVDGDASVQAVFELITDASGTADGVYVDDVRLGCRASNYDADSYYFNEGTSMATPHVAGVAALVRAAVPAASAAQVAAAIREGAVPMTSLAGKTVTGGRADAPAAIAAARRMTQPAAPPAPASQNPGDPANPAGPGAAGDRTPPRVRVGRASVRGPLLLLSLSFPNEPGAVSGSVGVARLQLGAARFRTRPGRAVLVKVRLQPAARRALASGTRARAVVTIRARDTAGNSSLARRRIRLQAP